MWCLIANVNAEKVIITLVALSFALTSASTLITAGNPLTKEEAIEISRNRPIVQEAFNYAGDVVYTMKAEHWDAAYIISLKEKHPNMIDWQNLPEDHGVWMIHWTITVPGLLVTHYIDEFTGEILFEGFYYAS